MHPTIARKDLVIIMWLKVDQRMIWILEFEPECNLDQCLLSQVVLLFK
jgi:hypothetical protein